MTRVGWIITLIGIPSAFLLHGYVGLHLRLGEGEPVVVVAADAGGVSFLGHGVGHRRRDAALHADLLVAPASRSICAAWTPSRRYLFYTFIIDFSLEMLDLIHRIYEADESFRSLDFMVHTQLYMSQIVIQILLGTVAPIASAGPDPGAEARRRHRASASMRWPDA